MTLNTGASLKANIIAAWKRHFVIEENLLEIEDPTIMPHDVLKTSGHVDRHASSAIVRFRFLALETPSLTLLHCALH